MVAKLNKALDEVRASEARRMLREGYEPVLKKTRWCLLKRPENLTYKQHLSLRELLGYNLKSVSNCQQITFTTSRGACGVAF